MAGKIWSDDGAVQVLGCGCELFTRKREAMESNRFRARSEPPQMEHLLRVVDRNFGRQHLVQNCGNGRNNGNEDEFLHGPRVVGSG